MRFKSPEKVVTREEIKRFAFEFDPQPYHLDEAAAEQTPLKGLAASGWHTAAIAMRLAVDLHPFGPHPLFGLGVDELRWLAPSVREIGYTSKARWSNSRRQTGRGSPGFVLNDESAVPLPSSENNSDPSLAWGRLRSAKRFSCKTRAKARVRVDGGKMIASRQQCDL